MASSTVYAVESTRGFIPSIFNYISLILDRYRVPPAMVNMATAHVYDTSRQPHPVCLRLNMHCCAPLMNWACSIHTGPRFPVAPDLLITLHESPAAVAAIAHTPLRYPREHPRPTQSTTPQRSITAHTPGQRASCRCACPAVSAGRSVTTRAGSASRVRGRSREGAVQLICQGSGFPILCAT